VFHREMGCGFLLWLRLGWRFGDDGFDFGAGLARFIYRIVMIGSVSDGISFDALTDTL